MKRGNTKCLERGENKYQQYQHSGQRREQPVTPFVAQVAQIADGSIIVRCSDVKNVGSESNGDVTTEPLGDRLKSRQSTSD